jgi:hypothetical protein
MPRPLASLALLVGAVLSTGCVERFAPVVPPDATRFVGASDEGFRRPNCPPMSFDVAIFKSPVTRVERIAGRASTPAARPGWRGEYLDGLWVEGYVDADNMAQLEVRDHPVSTTRVKTYWLWRGTRHADGSVSLREPQPSCGRAVELAAR